MKNIDWVSEKWGVVGDAIKSHHSLKVLSLASLSFGGAVLIGGLIGQEISSLSSSTNMPSVVVPEGGGLEEILEAFSEGFKGLNMRPDLSIKSKAVQLEKEYISGPKKVVDREYLPKVTSIEVDYVAKKNINGDFTYNGDWLGNSTQGTTKEKAKVRLLIDGEGTLAFQKEVVGRWIGPQLAKEALPIQIVGHELGHGVYSKYVNDTHTQEAMTKFIKKSGESYSDIKKESIKYFFKKGFIDASLNESFADTMSLVFLAKQLPKYKYELVLVGLLAQRKLVDDAMTREFTKSASSRGEDKRNIYQPFMDTHHTYEAIVTAQSLGYQTLHNMDPSKIPSFALDCAYDGIGKLVARNKEGFEKAFLNSQSKSAFTIIEKVGDESLNQLNNSRKELEGGQGFPMVNSVDPRVFSKEKKITGSPTPNVQDQNTPLKDFSISKLEKFREEKKQSKASVASLTGLSGPKR